jgi:hypothetical protein
MLKEVVSKVQASIQTSWYQDNGCPRHMTEEKHKFHILTLKEGGSIGF